MMQRRPVFKAIGEATTCPNERPNATDQRLEPRASFTSNLNLLPNDGNALCCIL